MPTLAIMYPKADQDTATPRKQYFKPEPREEKLSETLRENNWVSFIGLPAGRATQVLIADPQSTSTTKLYDQILPMGQGTARAVGAVAVGAVAGGALIVGALTGVALTGGALTGVAHAVTVDKKLASLAEQYEQIESSFPGVVINVEKDVIGQPEKATISVSIDGKDYLIERSIRNIGFEVKPEMNLEVDCVIRGGQKRLVFRVAQPIELDKEEIELLKSI